MATKQHQGLRQCLAGGLYHYTVQLRLAYSCDAPDLREYSLMPS